MPGAASLTAKKQSVTACACKEAKSQVLCLWVIERWSTPSFTAHTFIASAGSISLVDCTNDFQHSPCLSIQQRVTAASALQFDPDINQAGYLNTLLIQTRPILRLALSLAGRGKLGNNLTRMEDSKDGNPQAGPPPTKICASGLLLPFDLYLWQRLLVLQI